MCHLSIINLNLRVSSESYWGRHDDGQESNTILCKGITCLSPHKVTKQFIEIINIWIECVRIEVDFDIILELCLGNK